MPITKRNKQKGFTLIELMVDIAIVGLLSSVILVATKGSTDKANIAKTMQWSRSIESLLGPYAVGIWNFDEGSGTTVSDLSGYGNDGAIYGATWRCAEDDSDYTPSGQGCALEFDGSNDYIEISNLPTTYEEVTISSWVKYGADPNNFNGMIFWEGNSVLNLYSRGDAADYVRFIANNA
jgi:prepilin-type N-terminal cleavage/methylation domain-containing protein